MRNFTVVLEFLQEFWKGSRDYVPLSNLLRSSYVSVLAIVKSCHSCMSLALVLSACTSFLAKLLVMSNLFLSLARFQSFYLSGFPLGSCRI